MSYGFLQDRKIEFSALSSGKCQEIFDAALEVLERSGTAIKHREGLDLLKMHGCRVDGDRVRMPSSVVKKALSSVPSRVVLCDRYGNRRLYLEGSKTYFGLGPTNPFIIDPRTRERRKVTKADVADAAKVADALDNIDFVMSLALISDCTPQLADVHEIQAMLENTTKPIVGWAYDETGYEAIVRMCAVVAGDRDELAKNPFIALYAEPNSPLLQPEYVVAKAFFAADNEIPFICTPGIQLGGTAPATLAGGLVLGLVDTLTSLVLHQLRNPGAPYIGGAVLGVMDMKTTNFAYGSPEFSLGNAAMANIMQFLQIPVWGTAGCSDAKAVDEQAAVEATLSCYSAALSGANLVHDVGFMEGGMAGSLELVVLSDEIIGMVKRIVRGIEVNSETLALDVIGHVGPGGHFLSEDHTFNNFRKEWWFPSLLDRQRYDGWKNEGQLTLGDRLSMKVKEILDTHCPEPLSREDSKRLEIIVEEAEARYRKP